MSVIYNSKILLKTGYGYPGTVLDSGEAGYDISTNKFWLGNGIGNPPTGITMDPSFNYLYDLVINLDISVGNYATFPYVDGSLFQRDVSIEWLDQFKLESWDLYPYATNASVGLAIAPFATNSSVGLALAKYIPNASLGPNFYWDSSHYLKTQELKGTIFPPSPSEGDQFFRTDKQLLFIYDASRGRYLSDSRPTYTFGRTTLNGGTAGYLTMDGASHSSTEGLRAPYNGTVLSATVDNSNIVTRNLEIRVNNIAESILPLIAQKSNSIFNLNIDFSTGNILHIFSPSSPGNNLSNITFTIEVAWRI